MTAWHGLVHPLVVAVVVVVRIRMDPIPPDLVRQAVFHSAHHVLVRSMRMMRSSRNSTGADIARIRGRVTSLEHPVVILPTRPVVLLVDLAYSASNELGKTPIHQVAILLALEAP